MLGGVLAGVAMAYQLPALRLAFDTSSAEVLGAVLAGVLLVGRRRARRSLRPRRAHQVRGPDHRRRCPDHLRRAVVDVLDPVRRRGQRHFRLGALPRLRPGHAADGAVHRGAGERDELRRRPRRARRGHRHDRRARRGHVRDQPDPPVRQRPVLLLARAHRGGARRGLRRLPPAQLQPRPDLHGRLGIDAHRRVAGRRDDQRVRARSPGGRLAARLPARRWPRSSCSPPCSFVPVLDLLHGGRAAHPRGHEPVLARQDAPAPPAAGDRPQPAQGRAADLPVGGRVGVRGGGAHIHRRRPSWCSGRSASGCYSPRSPPPCPGCATACRNRSSGNDFPQVTGCRETRSPCGSVPVTGRLSAWFVPLERAPSGADEGEAGESPPVPSTPACPGLETDRWTAAARNWATCSRWASRSRCA